MLFCLLNNELNIVGSITSLVSNQLSPGKVVLESLVKNDELANTAMQQNRV